MPLFLNNVSRRGHYVNEMQSAYRFKQRPCGRRCLKMRCNILFYQQQKMNFFKLISSCVLLALIAYSCQRQYGMIHRFDNIPNKRLDKESYKYSREYGHIKDTNINIVKKGNLERHYKLGNLIEIGNVKNDKRTGYWFIYKDNLDLQAIIRYSSMRVDTFDTPFSIVDESW